MSMVTTAVCKSLQSLGISPRKEHQIENALVRQLESSGPEFVLSRLSELRDWRKMHMKGDTSYHPEWHAYSSHEGVCTPASDLESQFWGLSDKAFFAATGAVQKAIEIDLPSEKQLNKWVDGVRCENTSADNVHVSRIAPKGLDRFELQLEEMWKARPWFNVSDISGTNVPGSGKYMSVAYSKQDMVKDPRSLLAAYGFSCNTAPLFVWQFLDDIDAPSRMGNEVSEELVGSLRELIDAKLHDESLMDEALSGSGFGYESDIRCGNGTAMLDRRLGFAHSVGNIGFLEQSGGKLRTVANPNRLVQWVNIPLGKVLARWQDSIPGVFVRDQESGMKWAQDKLKQGIPLSSFDMSSATDRLDFSKWLHDKFHAAYTSPNKWPLLTRSLELFEDTSVAPWTIPGHVADLLGMKSNEISWSVGQPLGLRPSFPVLSLMNADFAKHAIRQVDGSYTTGHFACVGDDLIIETRYADAYMGMVKAFNGKINNDKTMESCRYAEFCSHMITRSSVYPIKPRFILDTDGTLGNIEKFSTSGLRPKVPKWARDIHGFLAAYHIDGMRKIPYSVTSSPKSLNERIGVNALIDAIHPGPTDRESVTLQTLYLRAMEQESRKGVVPAKVLSSSYADHAYPSFGGTSSKPQTKAVYEAIRRLKDYHVLGQVSTDKSTSVDLPVKTDWDYRNQQYKAELNGAMAQAKALMKQLSEVRSVYEEAEKNLDLIEASIRSSRGKKHQLETTVLIDTRPENPQMLIANCHITKGRKLESETRTSEVVQEVPVPGAIASAIRERRLSREARASKESLQALQETSESEDLTKNELLSKEFGDEFTKMVNALSDGRSDGLCL